MSKNKYFLEAVAAVTLLLLTFLASSVLLSDVYLFTPNNYIVTLVLTISAILTIQGLFTLIWMLYAWEDPDYAESHKSPGKFSDPKLSFTALIPARHEEKVIKDTISAVDNIYYPEKLKEIIVLCRNDDSKTISAAKSVIAKLRKQNIRIITFSGQPINKPKALNIGLSKAKNQVVCIFDAEDEPHPQIYNVINTTMLADDADVVQSGIQLMNYRSHWFSAINVMEYFMWFKSGLHFFTNFGKVTPLGGNTVFFKKYFLHLIGGWDEECLTEDADIGIRLTLAGAKTKVIYDENYVTQEETPNNASGFIKQRTRWNQGFLQILAKDDWLKLPLLRQKLIVFYVLFSPVFQALLFFYLPFGVFVSLTHEFPIILTMITFIPLYLILLQLISFIVGLYKFTKAYKLPFSPIEPFRILLFFYPYQLMLVYSAFRAIYRLLSSKNAWEKTHHANAHRQLAGFKLAARFNV